MLDTICCIVHGRNDISPANRYMCACVCMCVCIILLFDNNKVSPTRNIPWHYCSALLTEVMCFFCRTVAEVVSGVLQDFRPDLVLYDAGVDPHADDKLGRLKLTDNGLMRREMQVCKRKPKNRQTCCHLAIQCRELEALSVGGFGDSIDLRMPSCIELFGP